MKTEFQTHDLTLPSWGPYTKKYSGISHIPAANDGVRFDLAVFPGIYRRRVDVPDVRFESGYHVWNASPDLSCYTLRHELEWKDRVYADISFAPLADNTRLIRAELHNQTETWQNLVLHYMASAYDPVPSYRNFSIPGAEVTLPENAVLVLAKDYDDLRFAIPRPQDNLSFDGLRRGEEAVEGFIKGYGIGMNFGCSEGRGAFGQKFPSGKGDWVSLTFHLNASLTHPCLCIRYVNLSEEAAVYTLPSGEQLMLPHASEPAIAFLPLKQSLSAGDTTLRLTALGCGGAKLDCLILCENESRESISVIPRGSGCCPVITEDPQGKCVVLQYPHIRECYGIAWNDSNTELRQIRHDELDIFLRDTVQDHVSSTLRGNEKGHFTNLFFRPIPLRPGQTKVIYGVVCSAGTVEEAQAICRSVQWNTLESLWQQAAQAMNPVHTLPQGNQFALGQQLMRAVLCTNVVYPVYTRSQYIRHNTPGRWWDCLYTWDSGFIGMGLSQFSAQRGFDCLRAYLTTPGDDEAAFIHHGSLVPTQFYLYAELLNQTGSLELARYCYPRLRQYYLFFTGQAGSSTTANLKSGLLRPWDYFYNSGGWDDYPPQKTIHELHLEAVCTPVITTSHAIRCAKILTQTAQLLGQAEDSAHYLADITHFQETLQNYAWDEASGYFGYVLHDAEGNPTEILRDSAGTNHNMGLGGASPLFAGACTQDQAQRLWENLESGERLWSSCGLSTVDQSAPYYRKDGYWNGAVWMPYQWMFFKAALDAGRMDFAFKLSDTLLDLWQEECENSYHCFEHFMIESRRGAGWHQFGGLSSPVVQFYASYYRPGTITTGFDTFVIEAQWNSQYTQLDAKLQCTACGTAGILVVTSPSAEGLTISLPNAKINRRWPGLWEITVPISNPCTVELTIRPDM